MGGTTSKVNSESTVQTINKQLNELYNKSGASTNNILEIENSTITCPANCSNCNFIISQKAETISSTDFDNVINSLIEINNDIAQKAETQKSIADNFSFFKNSNEVSNEINVLTETDIRNKINNDCTAESMNKTGIYNSLISSCNIPISQEAVTVADCKFANIMEVSNTIDNTIEQVSKITTENYTSIIVIIVLVIGAILLFFFRDNSFMVFLIFAIVIVVIIWNYIRIHKN
jgi:hypothetical protein